MKSLIGSAPQTTEDLGMCDQCGRNPADCSSFLCNECYERDLLRFAGGLEAADDMFP